MAQRAAGFVLILKPLTDVIYDAAPSVSMGSETVYIMRETEDEWVQPTPAHVAIYEALAGATDLEREDLGGLEEYVDAAELRRVLDGDGDDELRVRIEGHHVTVRANGDIHVG